MLETLLFRSLLLEEALNQINSGEDETIDEDVQLPFSEYRREVETVVQYLYDYLNKVNPDYFFAYLERLLQEDISKSRHAQQTELILFSLQAIH